MTNFEYIKANLTERDIASIISYTDTLDDNSILNKAWLVFNAWAKSFSSNVGNMTYNSKTKEPIENPSIWNFEIWHYPDGSTKRCGRNSHIAKQVWLSKQYDEKTWKEAIDKY